MAQNIIGDVSLAPGTGIVPFGTPLGTEFGTLQGLTPEPGITTLPTSDLLAYWDAEDIVGVDGDYVMQWNNRIGAAAPCTPIDQAHAPYLKKNILNGRAGVLCDGGRFLQIATTAAMRAAMATTSGWSIVIFYSKKDNTDSDWNVIFGQNFSAHSGGGIFFQADHARAGVLNHGAPYLGSSGTGVLHSLGYSGERGRVFVDGTKTSESEPWHILHPDYPLGIGSTGGGGVDLGDAPVSSTGFVGYIHGFALYGQPKHPAEHLQAHLFGCRRWGRASPLLGLSYFLVCDGDSQTEGTNSGVPEASYPYQLASRMGLPLGGYANVGKPGAQIRAGLNDGNNMSDYAATDVDAFRAVTGLPLVDLFGEYYNSSLAPTGDAANDNAQGVGIATQLRNYFNTRKTIHADTVGYCWTSVDSQKSNVVRDAMDADLVSNPGAIDYVLPIHLDPHVGVAGSLWGINGNPPLTPGDDGAHPGPAGYAYMADYFYAHLPDPYA